jgi:hypothetical protein
MAALVSCALHVMTVVPGRDRSLVWLAATGKEPRDRCANAGKCRVHDRGGDRQNDDRGERDNPASPEEVADLAVAIVLSLAVRLGWRRWCPARRAVRA